MKDLLTGRRVRGMWRRDRRVVLCKALGNVERLSKEGAVLISEAMNMRRRRSSMEEVGKKSRRALPRGHPGGNVG